MPRPARTAAAIIAMAGLSLLSAACGGSAGSHVAQLGATATQSTSSSTPSASRRTRTDAVAFARCMRSKGVPNWPDPNSSGAFDKSKLTPSNSGPALHRSRRRRAPAITCSRTAAAAERRPDAAGESAGAAVRPVHARHGVPNFPDPGSDGRIPDPATVGINQGSPKFEAANQACGKYRPPYMPSNSAYNAYARTHG